MRTSRHKIALTAATLSAALFVTLGVVASAGANRNVTVTLDGGTTRIYTVGDSDPVDASSLSKRFGVTITAVTKIESESTSSTTTSSTTTSSTTTTTTTTPKPKPKPRPKPHRRATKPHTTPRTTARRPSTSVATGTLGIPGLTPLGTPDDLIANFSIPPFLLPIYQAAGIEYGIPWQVLAAINSVETDYGRNLSVSTAGALGWMQFMPATWDTYGVDASGDGVADPYNPVDAIFAAARYLKASGGSSDLHAAILSYNHAEWYVADVMHRAQLLAGLPDDIVASLTGLSQAMFPVAGKASVSTAKGAGDSPDSVTIGSLPNAPVVATGDGRITKIAKQRDGRSTITLRDAYGNEFYYRDLGNVAQRYVTRRDRSVSSKDLSKELKLNLHPEPTDTATAPSADESPTSTSARRRLFANPARPAAYRAGGAEQLAEAYGPNDLSDWFTVPVNIPRKDAVIKPLKKGSTVIAGTILGHVDTKVGSPRGSIKFAIRPAGKGAPVIDPRPIISGWKLLSAASRGANGARSASLGKGAPTIGQVLLLGKSELARRVLTDSRITIYECGRADIQAGGIDRRVLATLEYLADHGMNPTVSSLHCGHPYLSKSGNVSEHSAGAAVDVAAINGVPILGNQGPGSITDHAVRALLALQGNMHPHQIITLMSYPGTDNTLALADHDDHIHIGFHPADSASPGALVSSGVVLGGSKWSALIGRLREVPNPRVTTKPSRYATAVKTHD